jgi:hypothetical protein
MTDLSDAPVPDEPTGTASACPVSVRVFYGSTEVHVFQFDVTGLDPAKFAVRAAEAAFERLNIDHPPGWRHRSMSVGDVVVVGETALRCAPVGWEPVPADQLASLTGRGWTGG